MGWTPSAALPSVSTALTQSLSMVTLVIGGVTAAYCVILFGTWGATPGQRLLGIKVVKAPLPMALVPQGERPVFTAEKPGWVRSLSKGLCWALFSTGGTWFMLVQIVNVFLPLFHRRKQSLTDILASTLVVLDSPDA
jgi:uncharacterized RDD family membrane protein YckC